MVLKKERKRLIMRSFFIRPDQDKWLNEAQLEGVIYRAEVIRKAIDVLKHLSENGKVTLDDLKVIGEHV